MNCVIIMEYFLPCYFKSHFNGQSEPVEAEGKDQSAL